MSTFIRDIAYHLPEKVVTNEDLLQENPDWNLEKILERSGVRSRRVAEKNQTALDLSLLACNKLFSANPDLMAKVDGIVFCTQSEDYIMPPNSCLLHKAFGLPDEVFAMDYNLACSGFVYGLAITRGLLASGTCKNILLITADTYSKYIHPRDRSTRVLFGDGAAVTWISKDPKDGRAHTRGLIDLVCATSGKDFDKFYIPAGGCRIPRTEKTSVNRTDISGNVRTDEHIYMNGLAVLEFVKLRVPGQVEMLLKRNMMTLNDFDQVIFHQASRMAMDSLVKIMKADPKKCFSNIEHVGNTVSASIPIAIKDAMDLGAVHIGSKILLVGFGVGLSYASAIIEV